MEKDEKKLISLYSGLPSADRATLMAFAEFLAARSGSDQPLSDPVAIPRPEKESVIAAVKRLSATYPMIEKSLVLHETSGLVSQHLLQGREVVSVIDELEVVFRNRYEKLVRDRE